MMKRLVALLLALVMALSMTTTVWAADCTSDSKEHTWGEWSVTVAATCTTAGTQTRTCSVCNSPETATIEATGHTYEDETVTQAPTCTQVGTKTQKCSICNGTRIVDVPATGHSFGEWKTITPANCKNTGTKERECSVCTAKETETIPVTDNVYDTAGSGTVKTPATCTAVGKKTVTCTVCNTATKDVDIPALGHKFSSDPDDAEITKEPTCAEEGERTYKCQNKLADGKPCPETKVEPIEKHTEHTRDKGTVTT